VRALSDTLIAKPPGVLASGKRFFYRQIELPMAAAYRDAAAVITSHMLGDDALEGVSAFIDKRKPQWPT
jgi:enoyl-CoA hydratase/carnithine racemase